MMEKNFSLYALDNLKIFIGNHTAVTRQTKFLNVDEFQRFPFEVLTKERNVALLATEDHVAYWNKLAHPSHFFNILPERLTTINLCIYTPRISCLTPAISNMIFSMSDGGLLDIFKIQTIDMSYLKAKKMKREPKQLTLKQLEGGRYLFWFGIFSSFGCFLIELVVGWIKKK